MQGCEVHDMNICKENTDSLRTAKSASVFSLESFSCSLVWCMHIFVHCVYMWVWVCVCRCTCLSVLHCVSSLPFRASGPPTSVSLPPTPPAVRMGMSLPLSWTQRRQGPGSHRGWLPSRSTGPSWVDCSVTSCSD